MAISTTGMEEYSARYGYENEWVRMGIRYFSGSPMAYHLLHCPIVNNEYNFRVCK